MCPRAPLLLLTLATLAATKGVYFWCYYSNKYLDTPLRPDNRYSNIDTAKAECLRDTRCHGVTRLSSGSYSLRQGWQLRSGKSVTSWVPCGGYFRCMEFGLVSNSGQFLSVSSDGVSRWEDEQSGSDQLIKFHQWGRESGFLRAVSTQKYLSSAGWSGALEWSGSSRGAGEMFTVHQDEDKVAFESASGTYLTANATSSPDWFLVHPPDCLNNAHCNCSKTLGEEDYLFLDMVYHTDQGSVNAFSPERVAYQHIDNTASSTDQSSTFLVSETVSEKSSFSTTAGASVSVGMSYSTGVPLVGQYSVSVGLSAKYEFTTGQEKVEEKKMQAEYNCVAPAGKLVTCEALLFKYRMEVPYTQTWKHKRLPCSCESQGVFTEVAAHEMRLIVSEE